MDSSIETFHHTLPVLDETAPDFTAQSTQGELTLNQYTSQGKYVMLFSHPTECTPICTTECVEFARRTGEFEDLNVQLIGISTDSIHSHIAWMRNIEDFAGVKIQFPVVADLDQKISQQYGIVRCASSNASAVRAVFAIDPKQRVRVILYYPMQLGRNVDELLRVFNAVQVIDCNGVSPQVDRLLEEQVI